MLIWFSLVLFTVVHKSVTGANDFNSTLQIKFINQTWNDSFSNSKLSGYENKRSELENILKTALKNYTIISSVIVTNLSPGSILATVFVRSNEILNKTVFNNYLKNINAELTQEISTTSTSLSTQNPILSSTDQNTVSNTNKVVTTDANNSSFSTAYLTTLNPTSISSSNVAVKDLNNATSSFVSSTRLPTIKTNDAISTLNWTTAPHSNSTNNLDTTNININVNSTISTEQKSTSSVSSVSLPITSTVLKTEVIEPLKTTTESTTTQTPLISTAAASTIPVYAIVLVALLVSLIIIVILFGIIVIVCRQQKLHGYGRHHSEFVEMDDRWKYSTQNPTYQGS